MFGISNIEQGILNNEGADAIMLKREKFTVNQEAQMFGISNIEQGILNNEGADANE